MNQPVAPAIGNAVEVAAVMQVLTGTVRGPLVEVAAVLGGILLQNGGLVDDVQAGADAIVRAIAEGHAAEHFGTMVAAMGGPVAFVDNWARFLPEATVIREVAAQSDGYITAMDGEALGHAALALGAGRAVESDVINPAVGFSDVARLGAAVTRGQPLAVIHAARPEDADRAEAALRAAILLGPVAPHVPGLISERIG